MSLRMSSAWVVEHSMHQSQNLLQFRLPDGWVGMEWHPYLAPADARLGTNSALESIPVQVFQSLRLDEELSRVGTDGLYA